MHSKIMSGKETPIMHRRDLIGCQLSRNVAMIFNMRHVRYVIIFFVGKYSNWHFPILRSEI